MAGNDSDFNAVAAQAFDTNLPLETQVKKASELLQGASSAIDGKLIFGQKELIHLCLMGAVAKGHILLDGPVGVAKTHLVKCLGQALGLDRSRIQFTPDLMPPAILGTEVMVTGKDGSRDFKFEKGPVFAQLVHADEINRASPRTQSAFLQAMAEGQVTIDNETHDLPKPFMVIATQNPATHFGTNPLPEAQLDRFLVRFKVGNVDREARSAIMKMATEGDQEAKIRAIPDVMPTDVNGEHGLIALQKLAEKIIINDNIQDLILDLTEKARPGTDGAPEFITESFNAGADGERSAQAFVKLARARAMFYGRTVVEPQDVLVFAESVLGHRMESKLTRDAKPEEALHKLVASFK